MLKREPGTAVIETPADGASRNLALDGVRGCAILAVLASHLFFSNNLSSSALVQALLSVRDLLWVGVTLFFCLSGFLITGILFDTLDTERYFLSFFARRVLRIFPLYYGVLFVLLALTKPLHFDWHGQAWRMLTYTPSIPFVFDWKQNPSPYINLRHFWSLAVEEQFYLVWPFILFWLRSRRRIFLAAVFGAALALAVRTGTALLGLAPQNHTLPFIMDGLLLGGALALLVRSRHRAAALRWGGPVFLVAAAITLAKAIADPNFSWETSFYLATIGMTIIALGMTGLIASSLKAGSFAERLFSMRFFRFFGRYSYGLYVYHYSIDESLTGRLRAVLLAHGASKAVAILLTAAVVLLVSIAFALASYHLFEQWFLSLKHYFPYRRKAPRPGSPPALSASTPTLLASLPTATALPPGPSVPASPPEVTSNRR